MVQWFFASVGDVGGVGLYSTVLVDLELVPCISATADKISRRFRQ